MTVWRITGKIIRTCIMLITYHHHHHHHQAHAPSWSVAVSTRCFQCSGSWAHLQAELRPWLWGWRSAPRVRSHVWRGRPGGRFQSVGRPRIDVLSALEMSSDASILATWPKSRRVKESVCHALYNNCDYFRKAFNKNNQISSRLTDALRQMPLKIPHNS